MEDLDSLLLNEAFALPPEMLHENTLNSEILATRCVGLSLEDAEVLGFNISVPEPDLEPQSAPKPEVAASAVGDDEMDIDDDNENSFVYTTRIQTQPHQALSTTMSSPCDYEVRTPLSTLPGSPVAARWVHIEKNEGGGQAEGVSTHSSKGKGKGSGQCEGDGHQGTCVCTHSPNVLGVCLGPLVGVDATPEGEGQPEPQPEVIAEAEAEAQRVGEVTAEVMAEAAAEVVVTSVESVAGDETTPAPTAEESVPTAPTFGDTSSSFKSVSEVVDPETHETHTSAQPGGPDAAVHTGTTATAVHTGATHTPPTSRAAAPVAAAHTTPPTNPVFKILAATDLNAPPSSGVHTPSCHLKEQADHLQSESEGRPLSDAATTSEAFVLYNEDPELLEMLVPPVIIAQPIIVTKGVSSPPSSPLTPVTGVPWVIIGQPVFVPCINKEGVTAIFHGDPIVINDHDDDDMSSSPPSSQPSSPLSNITDMDLEESQPAPIPTARLTATLALGSSTPPSFRKSPRKASPPPSQYAVGKTSPSPQLDDAMAVEDMIDIDHSEPTPVLTPANEAPDQASEASRQMSELPSVEEESPKAPEFTSTETVHFQGHDSSTCATPPRLRVLRSRQRSTPGPAVPSPIASAAGKRKRGSAKPSSEVATPSSNKVDDEFPWSFVSAPPTPISKRTRSRHIKSEEGDTMPSTPATPFSLTGPSGASSPSPPGQRRSKRGPKPKPFDSEAWRLSLPKEASSSAPASALSFGRKLDSVSSDTGRPLKKLALEGLEGLPTPISTPVSSKRCSQRLSGPQSQHSPVTDEHSPVSARRGRRAMHAIEEVEEPTTRPDDTPERKRKANPSYTEEEEAIILKYFPLEDRDRDPRRSLEASQRCIADLVANGYMKRTDKGITKFVRYTLWSLGKANREHLLATNRTSRSQPHAAMGDTDTI